MLTATIRGLCHLSQDEWKAFTDNGLDLDKLLVAKPDTQNGEEFDVWHELADGSRLVPRFFLEHHLAGTDVSIKVAAPGWLPTDMPFNGELRENQEQPVAEVIQSLKDHRGALLRADCGVGKTVMGLKVASILGSRRLGILVDQLDLAEQWAEAIKQFLPDVEYVIMGGGKEKMNKAKQKQITIMVGQSLWRQEWADEPMELDLLLVDEAHVFSAPCFFRSLTNLNFVASLALTATPDRRDGLEWIFMGALGSRTVEAAARLQPSTIYRYPVQTVVSHEDYKMAWCARIHKMTTAAGCQGCDHFAGFPMACGGALTVDPTTRAIAWGTKLNYTPYLQAVIHDPVYIEWLMTIANFLVERRRSIMIFSQFQKHLVLMHEALELTYPDISGPFFGKHAKIGKDGRSEALQKQVTFCTYGVAEKGLDVPWKDAAIFASPRRDVRQSRGRVERFVAGKALPIIIDPVHTNSPILSSLARRRFESYTQAQCHVIDYPGL